VKETANFLNGNPFPCSILKLHQGNVKIAGMIFDNRHCVQMHNLRGHVERAALLIRASRYFENAELVDVEFTTARFDDDDHHIGVHISPIKGERYVYLDNVVFSNVKHGAVKCDRCSGNVTASDVSLLEVFQMGGLFIATGANFTLFDVNAVVTETILGNCDASTGSNLNFFQDHLSVTRYVLISLLVILIFSLSVEFLQNLHRCTDRSVENDEQDVVDKVDAGRQDHFVLKPFLSSASASTT
jgi:hypothetical protein